MPVERIVGQLVAIFARTGDVAGGQRVEPGLQRGDVVHCRKAGRHGLAARRGSGMAEVSVCVVDVSACRALPLRRPAPAIGRERQLAQRQRRNQR